MAETSAGRGVIPARAVRRTAQPVLLDCSSQSEGAAQHPISVVPILEGNSVAGFEVRCSCGASVLVECVYDEDPGQGATGQGLGQRQSQSQDQDQDQDQDNEDHESRGSQR